MGGENIYPKLCSHYTGLNIPDFFSVLTLFQHDAISFFRSNVWALCPTGYYLNGIRISEATHLYEIEKAKCCRPNNHPDAYEDCFNENVWGTSTGTLLAADSTTILTDPLDILERLREHFSTLLNQESTAAEDFLRNVPSHPPNPG